MKARFSVTFTEEKIAGKVNHVSGGSFLPVSKHGQTAVALLVKVLA